jgi:hypothetical protein
MANTGRQQTSGNRVAAFTRGARWRTRGARAPCRSPSGGGLSAVGAVVKCRAEPRRRPSALAAAAVPRRRTWRQAAAFCGEEAEAGNDRQAQSSRYGDQRSWPACRDAILLSTRGKRKFFSIRRGFIENLSAAGQTHAGMRQEVSNTHCPDSWMAKAERYPAVARSSGDTQILHRWGPAQGLRGPQRCEPTRPQ